MASGNILDIHFTAGNRSELDIKFRAVVAAEKSANETMSDFVKRTVVEWYENFKRQQEDISAAEKVRQELMGRIRELEKKIEGGFTPGTKAVEQVKDVKNNDKVSKLSAAW